MHPSDCKENSVESPVWLWLHFVNSDYYSHFFCLDHRVHQCKVNSDKVTALSVEIMCSTRLLKIRPLVLNEIGVFIFDLESNMFIASIPLLYIVFNYIICI